MTKTVKSCADCIFRVTDYCTHPNNETLGSIRNHYLDNTTHPSCPLRTEKITVELDQEPKTNENGN